MEERSVRILLTMSLTVGVWLTLSGKPCTLEASNAQAHRADAGIKGSALVSHPDVGWH